MAVLTYLQVNRICNQHCLFCSNPDNGRVLSLEAAKQMVETFISEKCDGIIITGGEPTLYRPLPDLISYARTRGVQDVRVTTNGQKTSDPEYLKLLRDSGLSHLHLSVHSHYKKVQTFLTGNPKSLENLIKTLYWAGKLQLRTDINMTTCRYNAGHIYECVSWICEHFPWITHFSWTNLDPFMNRVAENRHVVPRYGDMEESFLEAMRYLERTGRTFRVEKLPLCYMGEFAHCSTETRRIVKNEIYIAYNLDGRDFFKSKEWFYEKTEECNKCTMSPICAGLWEMGTYYDASELRALKTDPQPVIDRILSGD